MLEGFNTCSVNLKIEIIHLSFLTDLTIRN